MLGSGLQLCKLMALSKLTMTAYYRTQISMKNLKYSSQNSRSRNSNFSISGFPGHENSFLCQTIDAYLHNTKAMINNEKLSHCSRLQHIIINEAISSSTQ